VRPMQITWAAAVTTAVATAQTTAGAGNLTINGTLLDIPATMQGVFRAQFARGINRTVSLTSTGNISGVTVTITGKDAEGNVVSEAIAGPNNTTVYTTVLFNQVTSVAVNGAVGTAMSVGSGTTGRTRWLMNDYFQKPFHCTVAVDVTGTINYTVQDTPDDVQRNASPKAFDHPILVAQSADAESNYAFPARAVRCVINSATDGSLIFTVIQAG
jgi:hypothetical protein